MQEVVLAELRVELMALRTLEERLLDADQLAKLAHLMGLGWFTEEAILGLWRVGILRAEEVSSTTSSDFSMLRKLKTHPRTGSTLYCDTRTVEHLPDGYASSIGATSYNTGNSIPRFHPHRLLVLYHVQRTMEIATSSTQFFLYEEGVSKVFAFELEAMRRWTSSPAFAERFEYWNGLCEIATISEPATFAVVYEGAKPSVLPAEPLTDYEAKVRDFFGDIGRLKIEKGRQELASAAEALDSNRSVHVLLRLMGPRERGRLKGRLGCAMHFLAMAETIRRLAEAALATRLPEEDEIGAGQWFPGARKMLYGSDRVFDASPRDLRDYLTQLGLDFGVKVRCYVEGATEYGALEHAVGDLAHVQIIDLSGKFAERGGKGLAFSESLEADKRAGVFSVILLDGDSRDNVRLVERAAKDERFAGMFCVASPDFEIANFSVNELIDVAISLSRLNRLEPVSLTSRNSEFLNASAKVASNHALFDLLKSHGISDVKKDQHWGKALMVRAIEQPSFVDDSPRNGTKRPIVEVAEVVLRTREIGFQRSIARESVDPVTGRSISRHSKDSSPP